MLVNCLDSSHNDWDLKLPYVLFAYRTSKHASTKQIPFYLVFGRQARLPVELDIIPQSIDDSVDEDYETSLKKE